METKTEKTDEEIDKILQFIERIYPASDKRWKLRIEAPRYIQNKNGFTDGRVRDIAYLENEESGESIVITKNLTGNVFILDLKLRYDNGPKVGAGVYELSFKCNKGGWFRKTNQCFNRIKAFVNGIEEALKTRESEDEKLLRKQAYCVMESRIKLAKGDCHE